MLKKLFLTALLFSAGPFLFAADFEGAHAPVPQADRIKNVNNKRCAWNAIEMLARRAGEKSLYGISEKYEGPAIDAQMVWVLQHHGNVKYKMNPQGSKDIRAVYEFLVVPCQYEKRGVAVCITTGPNSSHMLNVVHYDIDRKKVAVIDNCDPKLEIKEWDWDVFHRRWNGFALVIYAKDDPFDHYEVVWP